MIKNGNTSQLQEARNYALRSLTCREQTEYQLTEKLKRRAYSDDVIQAVMEYLKEYNYINDERFLEQYIASHCHRLNRVQLEQKLYRYGFRKIRLDDYLMDRDYDEVQVLYPQLQSYTRTRDLQDPLVRKKVIAHFVNKGFSYDKVRQLLEKQATCNINDT